MKYWGLTLGYGFYFAALLLGLHFRHVILAIPYGPLVFAGLVLAAILCGVYLWNRFVFVGQGELPFVNWLPRTNIKPRARRRR